MKSNTAAHPMSATGEIFSHGVTTQDDKKIIENAENAPVLTLATVGGVTLISKSDHVCPAVEKMQSAEFVADLQHLTKMQLRRKYTAEANSHRNMLTRSKQRGNIVHPDLREFRNFLRLVGPMPVSGATLDRIDNTDPEYAPGKVRWADKRTQNNNKGDTLTIYDQRTGEVFTTSRLAKLQDVSASTIRKRLARGWSNTEIIAGTRSSSPPASGKQVLRPAPSTPAVAPRDKTRQIVPPRSRSAREIQFERMAEYIALCRERDGEEALPAPHYVINEGEPEAWHVTEEQWMARFEQWWPEYRPHIIFERADPYHQRAIERIDPEYVKRERAKIARREEMKALR